MADFQHPTGLSKLISKHCWCYRVREREEDKVMSSWAAHALLHLTKRLLVFSGMQQHRSRYMSSWWSCAPVKERGAQPINLLLCLCPFFQFSSAFILWKVSLHRSLQSLTVSAHTQWHDWCAWMNRGRWGGPFRQKSSVLEKWAKLGMIGKSLCYSG